MVILRSLIFTWMEQRCAKDKTKWKRAPLAPFSVVFLKRNPPELPEASLGIKVLYSAHIVPSAHTIPKVRPRVSIVRLQRMSGKRCFFWQSHETTECFFERMYTRQIWSFWDNILIFTWREQHCVMDKKVEMCTPCSLFVVKSEPQSYPA